MINSTRLVCHKTSDTFSHVVKGYQTYLKLICRNFNIKCNRGFVGDGDRTGACKMRRRCLVVGKYPRKDVRINNTLKSTFRPGVLIECLKMTQCSRSRFLQHCRSSDFLFCRKSFLLRHSCKRFFSSMACYSLNLPSAQIPSMYREVLVLGQGLPF